MPREWVTPDDAAIPGVVSASTVRAWAKASKVRATKRRRPGGRQPVMHVDRASLLDVLAKKPEYIAYIERCNAAAKATAAATKAEKERAETKGQVEQLREQIRLNADLYRREKDKLQKALKEARAEVRRLASTGTQVEIDRLTHRLEGATDALRKAQKRATDAQKRADQEVACRIKTEAAHADLQAETEKWYNRITGERDTALEEVDRLKAELDATKADLLAAQGDYAALQAEAEQHRVSATGAGMMVDWAARGINALFEIDQSQQADQNATLKTEHATLQGQHAVLQADLQAAQAAQERAQMTADAAMTLGWVMGRYGLEEAAQRRGMPDMADVVERLRTIDLSDSTYTDACIVAYSMTIDDVDDVLTAIDEHYGDTPAQRRKDLLRNMGWRLESGVRLVSIAI